MEAVKYVLECIVGVLLAMLLISLAFGAELEAQKAVLLPYVPQDTADCLLAGIGVILPCVEMIKPEDDHHTYFAVTNAEISDLVLIARRDERTNKWDIIWP